MCGITGYFSKEVDININEYYKAHKKIAHRGPDDEGFALLQGNKMVFARGDDTVSDLSAMPRIDEYEKSTMILGHRRLAILDVSSRGHQPFADVKERYILSYNGEIYNYIEIRNELKEKGYSFVSNSDTEVLLYAFMEWKEGCFARFNGMWAVAIFDTHERKLYLSRDRFGVKPLFYSLAENSIFFGSELKFLKTMFPVKVNVDSAKEYLNHMRLNRGGSTFYEGITEVKAGTTLTFDGQNLIELKYWNYDFQGKKYRGDETLEVFAHLFEDSLKLRMRSDVKVGSLLSGGLDSNAILGGLTKLGCLSENKYPTFSAVFSEEEFSEKKYIDDAETFFNIEKNYISYSPEFAEENLNKVLYYNEEPVRSFAVLSQYLLYKYIRENTEVRVVLNGQGADEAFAGYNNHYYLYFAQLILQLRLLKLKEGMNFYGKNRTLSKEALIKTIIKGVLENRGLRNYFNGASFPQITMSPLPEYLKYDDRNSMAFGIESRAPFMDYRLIEFAFSLDYNLKIDGATNKKIERMYCKDKIPNSILNRKDKMGFISPQKLWQKNELKHVFDGTYAEIAKDGVLGMDGRLICEKYEAYLNDQYNDWEYIWRGFCLKKWEALQK